MCSHRHEAPASTLPTGAQELGTVLPCTTKFTVLLIVAHIACPPACVRAAGLVSPTTGVAAIQEMARATLRSLTCPPSKLSPTTSQMTSCTRTATAMGQVDVWWLTMADERLPYFAGTCRTTTSLMAASCPTIAPTVAVILGLSTPSLPLWVQPRQRMMTTLGHHPATTMTTRHRRDAPRQLTGEGCPPKTNRVPCLTL